LLLSICAFLCPGVTAAEPLDRIVLRVNDQIATLADYQRSLTEHQQSVLSATDLAPAERQTLLAEAPVAVAQNLYEELLILSRSQQLDQELPEAAVDDAVRRTRERMGLASDAELERALAANGLTLEDMRSRLRRNLTIQQVMATEVRERIEIADEVLRKIYREEQERFRVPTGLELRELVVLADSVADRQERQEAAAAIIREIRSGAPFEEVAARGSAAGTTTGVIDLGWVEPGDLDAELEAAVWELEAGQVSEPVDARGGHHVLEVLQRRESHVRPFEEVREALAGRERESRFPTEYAAYLRELEEQAYLVFDLPPAASGFHGFEQDPVPGPELEEAGAEEAAEAGE
jgi:parvulin-like peptidyl-prolyl isomerase